MGKQYKKALAAILAVSLVWNLIPNISYAIAGQIPRYIVDDIETLSEEVMHQQVEPGTGKEDLTLPNELKMLVRPENEDDQDMEYTETATSSNAENTSVKMATSSNAENVDSDWRMVPVDWILNEGLSEAAEYNGEQPGKYVFDAEFADEHYIIGDAKLPVIEVEVRPQIMLLSANDYGTQIETGAINDTCTWTVYDSTGDGTADRLVISGTGSFSYSAAGSQPWNAYNEKLKTLVVEEGISGIGNYAFANVWYLTQVTLPEGMDAIGEYAFYNCFRLRELKIPEGVTYIGSWAFRACRELEIVDLPESLTEVGTYVFWKNSNLTIIIPEQLTSAKVGANAFYEIKKLYNLPGIALWNNAGAGTSKGTVYKIMYKESGAEGDGIQQKVLPSSVAARTHYEGTPYDAAYYFPDGNGNAWFSVDAETGALTEVTAENETEIFSQNPTLVQIQTLNWDGIQAEIVPETTDYTGSPIPYELTLTLKASGMALREGVHYTQEITSTDGTDADGNRTSAGTNPGIVTVTITAIQGSGYAGTRNIQFRIKDKVASVTLGEDGETTFYTTFAAAWNAAKQHPEGAVLRLLDIPTAVDMLLVEKGDNITLQTADEGYTITSGDAGASCVIRISGGSLTIETAEIEAAAVAAMQNAVELTGGRLIVSGGRISGAQTGVKQTGGELAVLEGTVSGQQTGIKQTGGELAVSGGTVSGTVCAVDMSDGSLTLSGGEILGEQSAIQISGGSAVVSGGSVLSTGSGSTAVSCAAGSIEISGSAAISGGTGMKLSGTAQAVVNGGNLQGSREHGLLMQGGSLQMNGGSLDGSKSGIQLESGDCAISDGTVKGGNGLYIDRGDSRNVRLSGGTYTGTGSTNSFRGFALMLVGGSRLDSLLVEGYSIYRTDGTYIPADSINAELGTVQVRVDVATVSAGDSRIRCSSIETAWAKAQELSSAETAATIHLLKDVFTHQTLTAGDGDNIILTAEQGEDGMDLTLEGDSNERIIVASGGAFTLKSGRIINGIINGYVGTNAVFVKGGNFVMEGGEVSTYGSGHSGVLAETGQAIILGGTVNSYRGQGAAATKSGQLTIEDGKIYGYYNGVYVSGSSDGTLACAFIKGGSITGAFRGVWIGGEGDAVISGGVMTGNTDGSIGIHSSNERVIQSLLAGGHIYYAVTDGAESQINDQSLLLGKELSNNKGYRTVAVKPYEPMVSVTVVWGALDFCWDNGSWDADTHSYRDVGWKPASGGTAADGDYTDANRISVSNDGEAAVTVDLAFTRDAGLTQAQDLSGSFWQKNSGTDGIQGAETDTGEAGDSMTKLSEPSVSLEPAGSDKKTTAEIWLSLSSSEPAADFKGTLGNVTVTIRMEDGAADEAEPADAADNVADIAEGGGV